MTHGFFTARHGEFSPRDIPGLELWLKASRGITTGGNLVSTWADLSKNGRNFVQATEANQPSLVQNISGGVVVRFDGSASKLANAQSAVTLTSFTIIASVAPNTSSQLPWYSTRASPPPTNGSVYFMGSQVGPKFFVFCDSSNPQSISGNTTVPVGQLYVYTLTGNSGSSRTGWMNGNQEGTGTPTSQSISFIPATLGFDGPNNAYWLGDVAEVCVYSGSLSSVQRQSVEKYLAKSYGIAMLG